MDERNPVGSARAGGPRSTGPSTPARPRPKGLARAAVAALAAALVLAPAAARGAEPATAAGAGPPRIVSESVVYCPATATVQFSVRFKQRPDFRTVDALGRREDELQFYVVGDAMLPYPQNYDAIVRGAEMTLSGRTGSMPIRRSQPTDPDPVAGGWGPVSATVPVQLRGTRLTFTAPLTALTDHSTDGRFAYELITLEFGATAEFRTGESVIGDC